jgi:isocitrate/isopropylmalate dehydrogenase
VNEGRTLQRTCCFDKGITLSILDFAFERAQLKWGAARIDRIFMPYKFQLLEGVFAEWIREWSYAHNVQIRLRQPDTMNRNLLRGSLKGRILIVASNEWADIMHVLLLDQLGLGAQENRFSRNSFLQPSVSKLVEYQTVHGSADDIAGKQQVNPAATLLAAAAILDEHAGCRGVLSLMEGALEQAQLQWIVTPDMGRNASTESVANFEADRISRSITAGIEMRTVEALRA